MLFFLINLIVFNPFNTNVFQLKYFLTLSFFCDSRGFHKKEKEKSLFMYMFGELLLNSQIYNPKKYFIHYSMLQQSSVHQYNSYKSKSA